VLYGRRKDFSRAGKWILPGDTKRFFPGEPAVAKFHFSNSKQIKKTFSY